MSGVEQRPVAEGEAGWRLDRWCRHHFPGLAHGALQKLMRTGQFRLDGRRVRGGERLQPGQIVRVPPLTHGEHICAALDTQADLFSERDMQMINAKLAGQR